MMFRFVCAALLFAEIFVDSTLCPDRARSCPIWGTCCENSDGTYGCCPYKNADCCADFIHCCPTGTHCNVTTRECTNNPKVSATSFMWMVPHYHHSIVATAFNLPTQAEETEMNDIPKLKATLDNNRCPDGMICDNSATCCKTLNGSYGCCPYDSADCCADGVHCCPDGYKCDIENRRCVKKEYVYTFKLDTPVEFPLYNHGNNEFEKNDNIRNGAWFRSKNEPIKEDKVMIVCPDKTESCPQNSTCCIMQGGVYGCCPMPLATCCADKLHCCPHGYICQGEQCEKKPSLQYFDQPIFIPRVPLK